MQLSLSLSLSFSRLHIHTHPHHNWAGLVWLRFISFRSIHLIFAHLGPCSTSNQYHRHIQHSLPTLVQGSVPIRVRFASDHLSSQTSPTFDWPSLTLRFSQHRPGTCLESHSKQPPPFECNWERSDEPLDDFHLKNKIVESLNLSIFQSFFPSHFITIVFGYRLQYIHSPSFLVLLLRLDDSLFRIASYLGNYQELRPNYIFSSRP